MDNKKDNRYFLDKILKDMTPEEFDDNEILQDSVMFRLIQISENCDKLTQDFKDIHPEITWRALKGMRNRIVHNYGGVDLRIIYETVTEDILHKLTVLPV